MMHVAVFCRVLLPVKYNTGAKFFSVTDVMRHNARCNFF